MLRALIVDDTAKSLGALAETAEREGFDALCVTSLEEARAELARDPVDIILLDNALQDGSAAAFLEELQAGDRRVPAIVLDESPDVRDAVRTMRHPDAVDYLPKPTRPGEMAAVRRHLRGVRSRLSRAKAARKKSFGPLLGSSPAMRELYEVVARVAVTDATVLVLGESGVGKELVASTIHARSRRSERPLVAINCGAIPENLIESELFGHDKGAFSGATRTRRGMFERADRGSLFLDEITEMPVDLQAKLLRVLETGSFYRVGGDAVKRVDVRVLAATNREPREAVEEGQLREDLLYRLSVFPVVVPPLRERVGDIELLVLNFLSVLNREAKTDKDITQAALENLTRRAWPGNVRQLQNAVHRAFILAESVLDVQHFASPGVAIEPALPLGVEALQEPPRSQVTQREEAVRSLVGCSLAEVERRLTLASLERYEGDKRRTAKVLGISLKTLYNRLKRYRKDGFRVPSGRPARKAMSAR